MIMLAVSDIDQEKLDYFQQGHTHLPIIHVGLDPGKYSAIVVIQCLRFRSLGMLQFVNWYIYCFPLDTL